MSPMAETRSRRPRRRFTDEFKQQAVRLVLDEAKRNGSRVPVTALVDQFYADVQKMGGNRWDTSSLIQRLK